MAAASTLASGKAVPVPYASQMTLPEPTEPADIQRLGTWLFDHNIQVICWDFDQTALTVHSGGYLSLPSQQAVDTRVRELSHCVAPGFKRFCRDTLTYLHLKHAIVSFADDYSRAKPAAERDEKKVRLGGTGLIARILDEGFTSPRPAFHIVSFHPDVANAVHQFAVKAPPNKNLHLQLVQSAYNVLDPAHVLLVDNDLQNVQAAKQAGYQAWYVAEQKGFDPATVVVL